jgi:hypothetical protein
MEKIIFFGLSIPILIFVIYLGGSAIMKGFGAKTSNRESETQEESEKFISNTDQLSNEFNKLNDLLKNGIITQEEFEKAKNKILDN